MSIANVKAAIETAINAMQPPLSTAWENVEFQSVTGVPYQKVEWLLAPPDNSTLGSGYYREQGYVQVTLFYPFGSGSAASNARVELLRATFARGTSFVNGGVKVSIVKTPEASSSSNDGSDRYMTPVRIRFVADIFT